jgi:CRISPR-associated endonuclease/helicase Cas3
VGCLLSDRCGVIPGMRIEGLGERALMFWAKSARRGSSDWLPLWRHLADSAEVASRLWDFWLPLIVRRRIAAALPGGDADGRLLLRWLAGIHDIGKATPAFAFQDPRSMRRMEAGGFQFIDGLPQRRGEAHHTTTGQLILGEWLVDRGFDPAETGQFAVVVGGHHGVPPTDAELLHVNEHGDLLGTDPLWAAPRRELLEWMADSVGVSDRVASWREVRLSQPLQAVLTGAVIVADWIASNEDLFPYSPDLLHAGDRLDAGWDDLDLPTPWAAVEPPRDPLILFGRRFRLPSDARPRPIQEAVVEAAQAMPASGMLIVEAPMGEGKTEAALAAVEVLAARTGAGGCFIALPTRATSDAMFSRVMGWLSRLPDADVGRGAQSVALVHGKAWLNAEFSRLYSRTLPGGLSEGDGGVALATHRWLAGRKKSMLSSFAIGTIDQLLFGALRARHLALRHLALAGKVVVIDEAHAYDVYMSAYLDRALEWLGAHGVPVVVLSATLPAGRRAAMMKAYDDGRFGHPRKSSWRDRSASPATDHYAEVRTARSYPLVSRSGADRSAVLRTCLPSGREVNVALARHPDDVTAMAETLARALSGGGCALVVCNTVTRVQATATKLREAFGDSVAVTVAHSRFVGPDRAAKDRWLVETFGPPPEPDGQSDPGKMARPTRHVVVASQVAEQSLDIDFDLLVTDLAPIDLMLQRIGRLHRHRRTRPTAVSGASCLVIGADWSEEPPVPAAGSVRVYDRSALLRSAAVLLPYLDSGRPLHLPNDISGLVQDVYDGQPVGPQSWQEAMAAAAEKTRDTVARKETRANSFRLGPVGIEGVPIIGWLEGRAGDAKGEDAAAGRAHVRDDGGESLDVVVLMRRGADLITLPWLAENGGVVVPTASPPPARLGRTIASCSLSLPRQMTGDSIDAVIESLEKRNAFSAWQNDPWVGGELILEIDERGKSIVDIFELEYDRHDGLRITRMAE